MASIAEEQAAADEFMLAETMFADGVEALEQNDFVEASDFLAQSLQFHAERSGDTSVEAAIVALKYAEALLGCARMKGTSILGGMGKVWPNSKHSLLATMSQQHLAAIRHTCLHPKHSVCILQNCRSWWHKY